MAKGQYVITLTAADYFQTMDALDTRAEAYERTAQYLDGELDTEALADNPFVIEEVSCAAEAREIAQHFRDIQSLFDCQGRTDN